MKDHKFIVVDYIVYSTSTTTHPPLPPLHPHQGKTKFNVHFFFWFISCSVMYTPQCVTLDYQKKSFPQDIAPTSTCIVLSVYSVIPILAKCPYLAYR